MTTPDVIHPVSLDSMLSETHRFPGGSKTMSEKELQDIMARISAAKLRQQPNLSKSQSIPVGAGVGRTYRSSSSSGVSSESLSSIGSADKPDDLDLCRKVNDLKITTDKNLPSGNTTIKSASVPSGHHSCDHSHNYKSAAANQHHSHGKWLSPSDYFQMARLRSTILATKMTGANTDEISLESSEVPKPPQPDVDKIASALSKVALGAESTGDKQADGDSGTVADSEDKSQPEDVPKEGELIGRGPIPVYSGSRRVYAPYEVPPQQPPQMNFPYQSYTQPPNGINNNNNDGYTQQRDYRSPMEFIQYQKQKGMLPTYTVAVAAKEQNDNQYGYEPPGYQQANGYPAQMSPIGAQPQQFESEVYQIPPPHPQQQHYRGAQLSPRHGDVSLQPLAPQQTHPALYQAQLGSPVVVQSPGEVYFDGDGSGGMQNLGYTGGSMASPQNGHTVMMSPSSAQSAASPFADEHLTTDDLNRILNPNMELPDSLSDFILKYSRRYSSADTEKSASSGRSSGGGRSRVSTIDSSPLSIADSNSPASVFSGSPPSSRNGSEGLPSPQQMYRRQEGSVLVANTQTQLNTLRNNNSSQGRYKPIKPKLANLRKTFVAKDKLRAIMADGEFEAGWAWALRYSQAGPGALYFTDQDGDSLLHIVVWHKHYGKVMGLVEMMLKDESPAYLNPFDLPNKLDETPLFLAVEKRQPEVVAYLLEVGADPNRRTRNRDGEAAIHYAASRGMTEIVAVLSAYSSTNLNLINGAGLTPLLCAVKNHGVIEEESQCLVNNKPTIRNLLKQGAEPKFPDASNGKTVLHYAVERMDPDLVEIFRDNVSKESMLQLVNTPMYNGDTPLHILGYMAETRGNLTPGATGTRGEGEEELRRKMFVTLVNCGADVNLSNSQGQSPMQQWTEC